MVAARTPMATGQRPDEMCLWQALVDWLAPFGYEDEAGFHHGVPASEPRCESWSPEKELHPQHLFVRET